MPDTMVSTCWNDLISSPQYPTGRYYFHHFPDERTEASRGQGPATLHGLAGWSTGVTAGNFLLLSSPDAPLCQASGSSHSEDNALLPCHQDDKDRQWEGWRWHVPGGALMAQRRKWTHSLLLPLPQAGSLTESAPSLASQGSRQPV